MRIRLMWLALVSFLVAANGAWASDPPYYLALGDSLAIGIQPDVNGQLKPTRQGYADDLHSFFRSHLPGFQLAKLGCSGETTSSMITGLQSPCSYPAGSQLSQAIAFLRSHRVVLITVDIGGDNLLGCLSLTRPIDPACVIGATTTAANDLAMILSALRANAPGVLIVGMNYYDPLLAAAAFGPTGATLASLSLQATRDFNGALVAVYQALRRTRRRCCEDVSEQRHVGEFCERHDRVGVDVDGRAGAKGAGRPSQCDWVLRDRNLIREGDRPTITRDDPVIDGDHLTRLNRGMRLGGA